MVEILLSTNRLNNNSITNDSVIAIMGIGKQTLPQIVYNDERVNRHFDLKIWYSSFNLKKVMNDILEYAVKLNHESSPLGILQSHIHEALCGKRYYLYWTMRGVKMRTSGMSRNCH